MIESITISGGTRNLARELQQARVTNAENGEYSELATSSVTEGKPAGAAAKVEPAAQQEPVQLDQPGDQAKPQNAAAALDRLA